MYRQTVAGEFWASASLGGRVAACGSAWLRSPGPCRPQKIWSAPRCPPRSAGSWDEWTEAAPPPTAQTHAGYTTERKTRQRKNRMRTEKERDHMRQLCAIHSLNCGQITVTDGHMPYCIIIFNDWKKKYLGIIELQIFTQQFVMMHPSWYWSRL